MLSRFVSKKTVKLVSNKSLRFLAVTPQVRNFQSPPGSEAARNPGALDQCITTYKDPRFKLDLKPLNWREGQWRTFTTDHAGMVIIISLCFSVVVLAVVFISVITYTDVTLSVSRPMTLRFLHVKNGKDMTDLNSFFFKTAALGNSQMFDLKTLFYNEIEDAIERRKQQDQLIS